MDSILKEIQPTIEKYAIVLSEILKVDIEIVDASLNRVAGTGSFALPKEININNDFTAYREVLNTGKFMIIDNPGYHEVCSKCNKKGNCEETFEMSAPIIMESNIIGVIGFVCQTNKQREHIMSNFDTFFRFLNHISELISSKVKHEIEKKKEFDIKRLLSTIIDGSSKGVIIYNEKNEIQIVNKRGKEILMLDEISNNTTLEIKEKGYYSFGSKVYTLEINNNFYNVSGEISEIEIYLEKKNYMFFFDDAESEKNKILNIAGLDQSIDIDEIIGNDYKMKILKGRVVRIAKTASTVLISGESGTGKELFARAIHKNSSRSNKPFIAINCAAIPDSLFESELFGYVKGAFTGSDPKGKIGKFELANGGTLFLDEIGDMPLYLQAKLLRVLQEKKVSRLGCNKLIDIDTRIIAATNKDIQSMIKNNEFREDLYYRLNVIPIEIPPLRERKDDILLLVNHFIKKYSILLNRKISGIEDRAMDYLYSYNWPGNIRELENVIEYLVNMTDDNDIIKISILPKKLCKKQDVSISDTYNLEEIEKYTIREALKRFGNNADDKKRVAKELGIGIATLYRKINKYKL